MEVLEAYLHAERDLDTLVRLYLRWFIAFEGFGIVPIDSSTKAKSPLASLRLLLTSSPRNHFHPRRVIIPVSLIKDLLESKQLISQSFTKGKALKCSASRYSLPTITNSVHRPSPRTCREPNISSSLTI